MESPMKAAARPDLAAAEQPRPDAASLTQHPAGADRHHEQPLAVIRPAETHARLSVLGIRIDNVDMDSAVQAILRRLRDPRPCQIAFVNAHCANLACMDAEYAGILRRTAFNFADGIGLRIAARVQGRSMLDNVNGTDLFPRLLEALRGSGHRVFLLGAQPGNVDRVRDWIARNYPGVEVAGAHHGYFSKHEEPGVISRIAASGADLILVAMGVPTQEKWLERHLPETGCRVGIGVGALFDFYSQSVPRAPLWMRRRGLEWVYRLCREPKRMWQRYVVGNPMFLVRVLLRRR